MSALGLFDRAITSESHLEFSHCPIGFNVATNIDTNELICYRLKPPEKFDDKFEGCVGNMYTYDLLWRLNFTKPENISLWAEYKTLYPGGIFIDWSHTESMGNVLNKSFEVKHDSDQGLDTDFCVVLNLKKDHLVAVRCDEKYHRYCFVESYLSERTVSTSSAGLSFKSPTWTCLTPLIGVRGGNVRATWQQAQDLCSRHNATLLQRGWRYANHPRLHDPENERNWTVPLGIIMTPNDKVVWANPGDDVAEVSFTDISVFFFCCYTTRDPAPT